MIIYAVLGILICIGLLFWRIRGLSKPVKYSGYTLLLVAAAVIVVQAGYRTTMGGKWYDGSPYKELILYLTMLLGMITNVLVTAVGTARKQIAELQTQEQRRSIKLMVNRYDFFYPFLLSFLTFFWLLFKVSDNHMGTVILLMAYETGFFYDSVISSLRGKYV